MTTDKLRYTTSVDPKLFRQIEDFRFKRRFQTRSEITVELMRLGLEQLKKKKNLQKIIKTDSRERDSEKTIPCVIKWRHVGQNLHIMEVSMLNTLDYCTSGTIWSGIISYVQNNLKTYQHILSDPFSEDDLLNMLKKNAKSIFTVNEYDIFQKALTSLKKGNATSLKKENLYRLCFVLSLKSDAKAQDLFLNYLHQNELSARSLDEFILIACLKLQLSWKETSEIRRSCQIQISSQPVSPNTLNENNTINMYCTVINEQLHTKKDLLCYLKQPQNLSFFAKTRNTQYLALFSDVELELLYNGDQEQIIKLVTDYGSFEKETILKYYHSLFGLQDGNSDDCLSYQEIARLCSRFEHVFMTYDDFFLLVQRKRPADISSGTFMLSLLKKLLTEETESEYDFYINFLEPDDFIGICNDILTSFGFPSLNPACDHFDRLLLDVYKETLDENFFVSNSRFQSLYMQNLRNYLRQIANACVFSHLKTE